MFEAPILIWHIICTILNMVSLLLRSLALGLVATSALAETGTVKLDFQKNRRSSLVKRGKGYLNAPLVEDVYDVAYYVNISIGTPPQVGSIRSSSFHDD
jgi:hypothetical protein